MKQSRTAWVNPPVSSPLQRRRLAQKSVTGLVVLFLIVLPVLVSLQMSLKLSVANGQLVIGGVPFTVLTTFLQDDLSRNAYLDHDRRLLHDRLQALGVEEQIKAFYRPQFPDEVELDQHIHQIFYDRTGYVGLNYRVNSSGTLVLQEGRIP